MTPHEQREHDLWQAEALAYLRVVAAEDLSVPYSEFQEAMDAWRLARREYDSLPAESAAPGAWVDEVAARHCGPMQRELGL